MSRERDIVDGKCQPGAVTDVVSGGAEPTSRRTRALLVAALLVAAALLALVAVGADRWWADRERDRLREAVLAGEKAVRGSSTSLAGLAGYSSRLLYDTDVPPGVRRSASANLGEDARRWVPRVQSAQQRVGSTDVLPWHHGVRQARGAYDLRLQAWADALRRFADDPQSSVFDDPADRQARLAAQEALRAAGLDLPE